MRALLIIYVASYTGLRPLQYGPYCTASMLSCARLTLLPWSHYCTPMLAWPIFCAGFTVLPYWCFWIYSTVMLALLHAKAGLIKLLSLTTPFTLAGILWSYASLINRLYWHQCALILALLHSYTGLNKLLSLSFCLLRWLH